MCSSSGPRVTWRAPSRSEESRNRCSASSLGTGRNATTNDTGTSRRWRVAKRSAVIVDGSAHWRSSRATTNGCLKRHQLEALADALDDPELGRRLVDQPSDLGAQWIRRRSAAVQRVDQRPKWPPAVELVGAGVNHAEAGWLGKDLGKEPCLADPSLALEQDDLADARRGGGGPRRTHSIGRGSARVHAVTGVP